MRLVVLLGFGCDQLAAPLLIINYVQDVFVLDQDVSDWAQSSDLVSIYQLYFADRRPKLPEGLHTI